MLYLSVCLIYAKQKYVKIMHCGFREGVGLLLFWPSATSWCFVIAVRLPADRHRHHLTPSYQKCRTIPLKDWFIQITKKHIPSLTCSCERICFGLTCQGLTISSLRFPPLCNHKVDFICGAQNTESLHFKNSTATSPPRNSVFVTLDNPHKHTHTLLTVFIIISFR